MRIIPVLDLQGGRIVRGIGGRRNEYRPIISNLAVSSEPVEVAVAFRSHFGLSELYIADLDAITGASPAVATFAALRKLGFRLCVDAGLRDAQMAAPLLDAGVDDLVFGLETLHGPDAFECAVQCYGSRVVFSLDLCDGLPLGDRAAWRHGDAWSIIERAAMLAVRRMIVLDLARVGTGAGVGTEALCARIAREFPQVEVIAGGGVRGVEDMRRLQACGVGGVLLASVLHDGVVRREHLAEFITAT